MKASRIIPTALLCALCASLLTAQTALEKRTIATLGPGETIANADHPNNITAMEKTGSGPGRSRNLTNPTGWSLSGGMDFNAVPLPFFNFPGY
jgi:hypothetical protein